MNEAKGGGREPAKVVWWYGEATGSWWAVARDGAGRWRLVEAASQAGLGRRLTEIGAYGGAAKLLPAVPPRAAVPSLQSAAALNRAPCCKC